MACAKALPGGLVPCVIDQALYHCRAKGLNENTWPMTPRTGFVLLRQLRPHNAFASTQARNMVADLWLNIALLPCPLHIIAWLRFGPAPFRPRPGATIRNVTASPCR